MASTVVCKHCGESIEVRDGCWQDADGYACAARAEGPDEHEPVLPCGCEPHITKMTNWGFHCVTENQGYCNFECPHEDEDCHPDCGPITDHADGQHRHSNEDGNCWHDDEDR